MRVHVAAGILRDRDGRVLLAERLHDREFAGFWEFPGGKVDPGESRETALARELAEELGIEVGRSDWLMSLEKDYADRRVFIEFFLVTEWQQEARGLLGQGLRWVSIDELPGQKLLPANEPVVDALRRLKAGPRSADAEMEAHVMSRLHRAAIDGRPFQEADDEAVLAATDLREK
jgi:8-oxo-dGTP diphosphatase